MLGEFFSLAFPPPEPGGYMTCGWTGVSRPVFRKVPSSNYRNLLSYHFYDEFCGKRPSVAIFGKFLDNPPMFMENLPKRDPCLENFGPKSPPIWAAHTRTLNMLCTPLPEPSQRMLFIREYRETREPRKVANNTRLLVGKTLCMKGLLVG